MANEKHPIWRDSRAFLCYALTGAIARIGIYFLPSTYSLVFYGLTGWLAYGLMRAIFYQKPQALINAAAFIAGLLFARLFL